MTPTQDALERLLGALRLDDPPLALYNCAPSEEFEPLIRARGRACCFAYYGRWLEGKTLVVEEADDSFDDPSHGCPGLQRALGLGGPYPPWMAHFLTDGEGAPMGEGLKATPRLAQDFLDRAKAPPIKEGHILIGPLRLSQWRHVEAITFLVDPDRLSALMTLATYWTSAPDEIAAPFSSGCGLMWRELRAQPRDRAILGCTDIAMRRYLPPELLCLTVSPSRFTQMLTYPDGAFLNRSWWKELLDSRQRSRQGK